MKRIRLTAASRAGVAVLALLTAGCTVGPDYRRPDTPVPAMWSEARYDGIDTRPADLARWWEEFNDPDINAAGQSSGGHQSGFAPGGIAYSRSSGIAASRRVRGMAERRCERLLQPQPHERERHCALVARERRLAFLSRQQQWTGSFPVRIRLELGDRRLRRRAAQRRSLPTPRSKRRSKTAATSW